MMIASFIQVKQLQQAQEWLLAQLKASREKAPSNDLSGRMSRQLSL